MNFKSKRVIATIAVVLTTFSFTKECSAFPIDFAPGTPIIEAVRALGYKAGKDIVINGNLKGTLSIHMKDTNFESALHAMSIAGNFSYDFLGNTVLIAPSEDLNTMETFKLHHLEPESFAKQLELIVKDGDVVVNKDNHTIAVKGSSSALAKVRNQIENLDKAQQQINIKATLIEISKSKMRNIGLSYLSDIWTKDTSISGYNGFRFSITGAHEENLGTGNVLARPNITTFDGRNAKILIGDKVPVFTSTSDSNTTDSESALSVEYKEVGVKLEVMPRINDIDKETITMTIKPSVSTISQWVESGNNKAPQISERSAETTVRVKAGDTILLGGLLKEEEIKNIKQIPFLSKLPILGELFKSRSIDKKDTEILIAITPTIIYDSNGIPNIELQETTPKLNNKLKDLKTEKTVSNVQGEKDINIILKEKEDELTKLKKENKLLEKELQANNTSLKDIIDTLERNK